MKPMNTPAKRAIRKEPTTLVLPTSLDGFSNASGRPRQMIEGRKPIRTKRQAGDFGEAVGIAVRNQIIKIRESIVKSTLGVLIIMILIKRSQETAGIGASGPPGVGEGRFQPGVQLRKVDADSKKATMRAAPRTHHGREKGRGRFAAELDDEIVRKNMGANRSEESEPETQQGLGVRGDARTRERAGITAKGIIQRGRPMEGIAKEGGRKRIDKISEVGSPL